MRAAASLVVRTLLRSETDVTTSSAAEEITMPELANRDKLEADFAKKFGAVARAHLHEFREYLGTPPSLDNVPQSFMDRMEKETENNLYPILFWIFGASAADHGWATADAGLAAYGYASGQSTSFARYWVQSIWDRTRAGLEKLRNKPGPTEETVDEARESNARIQQHEEGEIEDEDLDDLLEKLFGPKRIEGVAVNETTRARHAGGEAGVEATVGLSDEDEWACRPHASATGPCEICESLDGAPRSVWSIQFPGGPPEPHSYCVCVICYLNALLQFPMGKP